MKTSSLGRKKMALWMTDLKVKGPGSQGKETVLKLTDSQWKSQVNQVQGRCEEE